MCVYIYIYMYVSFKYCWRKRKFALVLLEKLQWKPAQLIYTDFNEPLLREKAPGNATFESKSESVSHSVISDSLWPHRQSPGSSVHGIFQASILEWVTISFSEDLSDPAIKLESPLQADSLPSEPPGKPEMLLLRQMYIYKSLCRKNVLAKYKCANVTRSPCFSRGRAHV